MLRDLVGVNYEGGNKGRVSNLEIKNYCWVYVSLGLLTGSNVLILMDVTCLLAGWLGWSDVSVGRSALVSFYWQASLYNDFFVSLQLLITLHLPTHSDVQRWELLKESKKTRTRPRK